MTKQNTSQPICQSSCNSWKFGCHCRLICSIDYISFAAFKFLHNIFILYRSILGNFAHNTLSEKRSLTKLLVSGCCSLGYFLLIADFSSWLARLLHCLFFLSWCLYDCLSSFSLLPFFPCVCVCVRVSFHVHACIFVCFVWMCIPSPLLWFDIDRDLEQPTETSDSLLVEGSGDLE